MTEGGFGEMLAEGMEEEGSFRDESFFTAFVRTVDPLHLLALSEGVTETLSKIGGEGEPQGRDEGHSPLLFVFIFVIVCSLLCLVAFVLSFGSLLDLLDAERGGVEVEEELLLFLLLEPLDQKRHVGSSLAFVFFHLPQENDEMEQKTE